jgi:hypothetical protein
MSYNAKIADVFHTRLYSSKMWTAKVGILGGLTPAKKQKAQLLAALS